MQQEGTESTALLSKVQRTLVASQVRSGGDPVQNMVLLCHVDGPLDAERLCQAFAQVVANNDVLRTTLADPESAEVILSNAEAATEILTMPRADAVEWAQERAARPLDLSTAVFDSAVAQHEDDTSSWFLNVHHLATDAASFAAMIEATSQVYLGHDVQSSVFYASFEQPQVGPAQRKALNHWDVRSPADRLGRLYSPRQAHDAAASRVVVSPSTELADQIALRLGSDYVSLTGELASTSLLVTAAALYTHVLSGQSEMSIGLPVHNRRSAESQSTLGPLMELYPVDISVKADDTARSLHKRVARSTIDTLRNALPGTSPDPDFDIVVNIVPGSGLSSFGGHGATLQFIWTGVMDAEHLLRVQLTGYAEASGSDSGFGPGTSLHLDLSHSATPSHVRDRADRHFASVLQFLVDDPDVAISDCTLTSDQEQSELAQWGAGPPADASHDLLPMRLCSQLQGNHETVLVDGDDVISGDELWRWATVFSRELVGEQRVAIELGPSMQAVVAIYAAVLAGVPFVPLDITHPVDRRDQLCDAAAVTLRVTREQDVDAHRSTTGTTPAAEEAVDAQSVSDLDEAYVIFTSGSSGLPKGVPITHRGLAEYVGFAIDAYFGDTEDIVAPLFGSLAFDLTITSLFAPILSGGRLHAIRAVGAAAMQVIADSPEITWCKATPSHLEILAPLLRRDHGLSTYVVGGEAFRTRLALDLSSHRSDVVIFNEYGPTEAVVGCMVHRFGDADQQRLDVPIGVPAPGVHLCIVDTFGNWLPPGASGELCISSAGVTSGYLGEADRESFRERHGRRWYRSGDLAQLNDQGLLVYQGRIDEQLKVGGIRVDPVEIEEALNAHPAVAHSAVRLWAPEFHPPNKRCVQCGLADTVPGTTMDESGTCNTCLAFESVKAATQSWFRTAKDLTAVRDRSSERATGEYDCLAMLSGGKDSTYALYQLVEQGFRPYAFTLDNGFISEGAKNNIRSVAQALDIDYEFATTPAMNRILRDSLTTFSNVCHGCYKTIYTLAVNRADELGIPLIVTGLSRGQLFETRLLPEQFRLDQFDPAEIDRTVIEARKHYHRAPDTVNRLLDTDIFASDDVFEQIEFLDIYRYLDVELEDMLSYLVEHTPWRRPADTGRSTNCLINVAGIHTHQVEQGYHNYAIPYAWDVRLGHKTRSESIAELEDDLDMNEIDGLLQDVGYEPRPRSVLSAWIQPTAGFEVPSPAELRRFVASTLPRHSVPAAYVIVDTLPMTNNGKIDTRSLPAPSRVHRPSSASLVLPNTEAETAVVQTWESVLGVEPVSVTDDFFALGGDSLAALGMIMQLGELLNMSVDAELAFVHTTPQSLAAAIEQAGFGEVGVQLGATRNGSEPAVPKSGTGDRSVPPPLTIGESSVLFEQRSRPSESMFNLGRIFRIEGRVDGDRLTLAVRKAAALHEPLRVSYGRDRRWLAGDRAVQVVVADQFVEPSEISLLLAPAHRAPFDIENGPLLRCVVQPITDGTTAVLLAAHHVAIDLDGFTVLWNQIDALYCGNPVLPPAVHYADYIEWQQEQQLADKQQFWLDRMASFAPTSFDQQRDATNEPDGFIRRESAITASQVQSLRGATPVAVSAAATAAALAPYFSDNVVPLSLVASTRTDAAADELVGYLLNPLPIQLVAHGETSIDTLVERAARDIGSALPWRAYPVASRVDDARRAGHSLADISVLLSIDTEATATLAGQPVAHQALFNGSAVADLSFFVEVRATTVDLALEYSGSTVGRPRAEQVLDRFAAAFQLAFEDRTQPVAALQGVAKPSVASGPALLSDRLVLDRILDWPRATPDAPAVTCADSSLTWTELLARSETIADALVEAGVGPRDRVAVSMRRSVNVVAALLGIQLAGASYVPIDPTYPEERMRLIGESAGLVATIVDADSETPVFGSPLVVSEIGVDKKPFGSSGLRHPRTGATDPAYTIFTSGSTGAPSGVEVTHEQLSASTNARAQVYPTAPSAFAMLSSYSFDSSVVGLFWTLACGGNVVLPTEAQAQDIDALAELLSTREITHMLCVPTLYAALLKRRPLARDNPAAVYWPRHVIVAGEACPPSLVTEHHRQTTSALTNEYGPTETTVWATAHRCRAGVDPVPIGKPIPGTWVAVVDRVGVPVPVGVAGELIIGGAGVTGGYVANPELTAERFGVAADDMSGLPAGRFFRTADMVVMNDDDELCFLGRFDDQLNVGGNRVEPQDIEAVLLRHKNVEAAVVGARNLGSTTAPDEALVAFIETSQSAIDLADLQSLVAVNLPVHLRPRIYVPHAALPRTPNGKIDRAATLDLDLPAELAQEPSRETASGASTGHTEAILSIFRQRLRQPSMTVHDSFFEKGGNSLLALDVLERIEEAVGTELSTSMIFEYPTAVELAKNLKVTGVAAKTLRSLVMPLQTKGEHPPIFAVHHLGPNAKLFRPLAGLLGDEQPMYGLAAPLPLEPWGRAKYDTSIEYNVHNIAASYVGEIQRLAPDGPVVVAGTCQGALFAYEVAQQLRSVGREVPLLLMLTDWHAPEITYSDSEVVLAQKRFSVLRQEGWKSMRKLLTMRGPMLRAKRLAEIVALRVVSKLPVELPHQLRIRAYIERSLREFNSYVYTPYDGEVLVVRGSDDQRIAEADRTAGWGQLIKHLEIEFVPGWGTTILLPPHISSTTEVVRAALQKAMCSRDG